MIKQYYKYILLTLFTTSFYTGYGQFCTEVASPFFSANVFVNTDLFPTLDGDTLDPNLGYQIIAVFERDGEWGCAGSIEWRGEYDVFFVAGESAFGAGYLPNECYQFFLQTPDGCIIDEIEVSYAASEEFPNEGCYEQSSKAMITSFQAQSRNWAVVNVINGNCGESASAEVLIDTPVSSYEILWSNGSTEAILENLENGSFSVTITDGTGCSITETIEINNSEPFEVSGIIIPENCANSQDGSIMLEISGTAQKYNYEWNTGANSKDLSEVGAGEYIVTVTDEFSCQVVETFVLESIPEINPQIQISNCCGDSTALAWVVPANGTPPYEILWSTGQDSTIAYFLPVGDHSVTIQDANGCQVSENFTVEYVEPLQISDFTIMDESEAGQNDGSIDVTVMGGGCDYSYRWFSENDQEVISTEEDISNLESGNYSLFINLGGCGLSMDFMVGLTVDVEEVDGIGDVIIFPNPTKNLLQAINLSEKKWNVLQLFDVQGRLLQTFPVNNQEMTINLKEHPTGVYFLKLKSNAEVFTKKIIKQ